MKIKAFISENFKRLKVVEIIPTGNVVEITGRNGQGKTSVLDAIWVALAGLGAAPSKPIRKGQKEARIKLDLGDAIVTRTFKEKDDGEVTSALTITSADGAKFGSPQTMLDKLVGKLTFDPLEFSRMDRVQQFDTLRAFVPGVNFQEIEEENRKDYDRRALHNRTAHQSEVAAGSIILPQTINDQSKPIDKAALIAKLDDAGKHNTDIETRKANRQRISDEVVRLRREAHAELDEIAALEESIKARRALIARYESEADEKQKRLAEAGPLPTPVDTSTIREEIADADKFNALVEMRDKRAAALAVAQVEKQRAAEITARMEERTRSAQAAVAAANLPVPGITFGNREIILNDIPFAQASDAEKLRVSMAIAMAMNPKLRIIRVRDGSLLDDESMKLIAEMADASDFQVWIERVDSSGKVGIVLEDGHVKTEG